MNENKTFQHVTSETEWRKELPFSHCNKQNSAVLKSHVSLLSQPYTCANIVSVQPVSMVTPQTTSKPELFLLKNSSALNSHGLLKSELHETGGIHEQYMPQPNFSNVRAAQICNAQQTEKSYYSPNVNKTESSQHHMQNNLSMRQISNNSNILHPESGSVNQYTSTNFNKHGSSSVNSNFSFNAPHSAHIRNGFSSNEMQPSIHFVNARLSCPQSCVDKVCFDNSQTIKKDNYSSWPQICSAVPPPVVPLQRPVHNPSFPSSCTPPLRYGEPQLHANTLVPPSNHPIRSHFSGFPSNTTKCSDSGSTMQFRYPPPAISKVNVHELNTFTSDRFPSQQSLVSPNVAFPPPPTFPPNIYCTLPPPLPAMSQNFPGISNFSCAGEQPEFKSEKERMLLEYLQKFHCTKKKDLRTNLTIVEFSSALKIGFSLSKILYVRKSNLTKLLQAEEDVWKSELNSISQMQNQLADICNMISNSDNLHSIQRKLKLIKKKREQRKRLKQKNLAAKIKAEQERKEINQEIDKWLDCIKEKNLKFKREAEMKKEADSILSEVRRKIHEAKRTIEKIKVFEKLRNARQANAIKKSLFVLPEHNDKFEKKVFLLKETMLKQLMDYEAEEKALKVMLETEQEGQLEEEAVWRLKKRKSLQQKKQKNIIECLFGDAVEPSPEDPLYLFYKYQDSANGSIENLVQIRHHWDVHLAEDGDAIPQQWVIPVPPSNASWEILSDMIS